MVRSMAAGSHAGPERAAGEHVHAHDPRGDDPHVELRSVTKRFGPVAAVDALSLDIARGSFTTLLGPSGCGKTTTLRMLAGFFDPDEGEILIDGVRVNGIPPHRRNVSIVFQDYALFPHMTVLQNVGYGLTLRRVPRQQRHERIERVLDFLGLTALARRHPHELSGGQQQRVALGRSIVMEPAVLLMDEPLSNLDAKLRIRVRAELKEIQRELGITTVYVTHDQDEALSLSDRVAVLSEGALLQYSDPWRLYHAPVTRFVADFVGYANLLPARAERSAGGVATVRLLGRELRCADPGTVGTPGAEVMVMARPEWIAVATDEGATAGQDADGVVLLGRVRTGTFLGSHARFWLEVEGIDGELVVDAPVQDEVALEPGARLRLLVPHDRTVLLR